MQRCSDSSLAEDPNLDGKRWVPQAFPAFLLESRKSCSLPAHFRFHNFSAMTIATRLGVNTHVTREPTVCTHSTWRTLHHATAVFLFMNVGHADDPTNHWLYPQ